MGTDRESDRLESIEAKSCLTLGGKVVGMSLSAQTKPVGPDSVECEVNRYVNNSDRYRGLDALGRFSCLESQPFLGLWAERRPRCGSGHSGHLDDVGATLDESYVLHRPGSADSGHCVARRSDSPQ